MRVILAALGMSDYGIYTVVAGVVSLLGFITNSLVISTQRFISYYNGKGDVEYVKKLFSNSLFLHFVLGLFLALLLILLQPILFNHVLTIDSERIQSAEIVYLLTILMLFMTILTASFKAVLIAHENIVYISIIEIADSLLRLVLVMRLPHYGGDSLIFYSCIMAGVSLVNFIAFSGYSLVKYPECHLQGIFKDLRISIQKQFSDFVGWTTYGMGSIILRNQGIAVIFNHFFGSIINAAYGIAMNVYGSVTIISTSIMNALNPQIMKAEGYGNRELMLHLSEKESKYSEMLLLLILTPLLFEMPSILMIWLGQTNEDMVFFSRILLIGLMFDQVTLGLNAANQALGKLRNYCLLMYTPKLLILPLGYLILYNSENAKYVMYLYLIVELLVSLMRLPYLHVTAGLDIPHFIREVFLPLLPLACIQFVVGSICVTFIDSPLRWILTIGLSLLLGTVVSYYMVLNRTERAFFYSLIHKKASSSDA